MERKNILVSVFNLLGGMSGLLAIGLVVWKGGALAQTVIDHGRRLDSIESSGSVGLREHVKLDDERVKEMQVRISTSEAVAGKVTELVGEVRVINVKLDALKEQLQKK